MKSFSVTTVLNPFVDFSKIDPEVLRAASVRGQVVHDACASYALDMFVSFKRLRDFDPTALLFFQSFQRWFDQYVGEVIFVEKELTCPIYQFIGHLDLFATMTDGRKVIVDYKTPAVESRSWRAQLSGYRHLVDVNYGGKFPVMALMLNREGRAAKAITYQHSDEDFAAFLSALNAHRYFYK